MFKKKSKKTMKITPRDAERILQMKFFGAQRPLRPRWVSTLANIIREDLFLNGEIGTAILKYDGNTEVLINGQHQCHAVIVANKAIEVEYTTYECDTPDDTSTLYAQFDNHSPRSLANVVKAHAFTMNLDWPNKCCSLLVGAAAVKENIETAPKYQKSELLDTYLKQGQFIHDLLFVSMNGANIHKDSAHLRRLPTVYAMLHTWEKSQSESAIFWKQVRDGEGLSRTMPAFKLRNYLMTTNYHRGRGTQGVPGKTATFHEMVSKSIVAWNAFRKHTTTDLKYYRDKPIPRVV